MKKDRRQINEVWEITNQRGERYKMARVGSGKNAYTKTLEYLGKVPQPLPKCGAAECPGCVNCGRGQSNR